MNKLVCDECGTSFNCGAPPGKDHCWCMELPNMRQLSHIWQFHAPAMVLAGRRAAVEGCSAFITDQLVHVSLRALDTEACAMSNDHASIAESLSIRTSRTGYNLSVAIRQGCAITLPMRAWWNW